MTTITKTTGALPTVTISKSTDVGYTLPSYIDFTNTTAHSVSLAYVDASTNYFYVPIDGYLYWARVQLDLLATGFWTMGVARTVRAIDATNDDDVGITYNASWGAQQADSGCLGGNYRSARNAAGLASWTVTGVERVYIAYSKRTNGGYMEVMVDGAPANGADLVTVGADKCLDCYAAATSLNNFGLVATGLDPDTSYTLSVAPHGTGAPGSSDYYVYFEGYGYVATSFEQTNGTVSNDNVLIDILTSTDWGYAYQITPTGASAAEFTGSDHLNEAIGTVAWVDGDGTDVTVSGGDTINSAAIIKCVQTGTARHSETSTTDLANIITTLQADYMGILQSVQHTWLVGGVSSLAYVGMIPGTATMNRAAVSYSDTSYELDDDDGSMKAEVKNQVGILYSASIDFIMASFLTETVGVNSWNDSVNFLYFDDKASTINKLYYQRVGTNTNYTLGDVWTANNRFIFQRIVGFTPV